MSTHTRSRYDTVIVGARAAGAATAMLLARRGQRVLLVEAGTYGSDTLSTHALMRPAVLQLSRWGLLSRLEREGTPPIGRTVFHYDDEVLDVPIKPKDGVPALFAPRRTVLDRVLVDAAAEAGAEVRHRTRLVDLLWSRGRRVEGAVLQGSDGTSTEVRGDAVVGADGMRSSVARLVDAPVTRRGRSACANLYGYWEGLPGDAYHWYWSPGHPGGPGAAAGAIPTNGGLTLLFASISGEDFAARVRTGVEDAYRRLLSEAAPGLARGLSEARLAGSLSGSPGHRGFMRRPWGAGWALVGDAGHFKDPITAHGISDALRDAELLASALMEGGESALLRYEAARDALSTRFFELTDRIASLEWDTPELKSLHHALSDEMKRETATILGWPAPSPLLERTA